MTVDVNALTSSISLVVTEAVQRAFEKIPQKQVHKCQHKFTGVDAVVDEEVSLLIENTPPSTSSNPLPLPGNKKPLASIAVALGSHVTPKLKRKIWANEYSGHYFPPPQLLTSILYLSSSLIAPLDNPS